MQCGGGWNNTESWIKDQLAILMRRVIAFDLCSSESIIIIILT